MYAPSTRPLLLLLDGHSSHYCPETIRAAAASQIIIFALPPHTTHLTQPLDKSAFACLKKSWRKVCHEFIVSNPGHVVTRYEFSMRESMTIRNVSSGFTVTGICPFERKLPELDFEPEKIPQANGIAYIPLYSTPSRRSCCNDSVSSSCYLSPNHSGTKINTWPSRFVRDAPCRSFPRRLPTKHGKKSGAVLTSTENLRIINIKEDEKKEKERLKAERQRIREEKKLLSTPRQKRVMVVSIMLLLQLLSKFLLHSQVEQNWQAVGVCFYSTVGLDDRQSGMIDSELSVLFFY